MARKLSPEEANVFGQIDAVSRIEPGLANEEKLLEALKRQRQQPLELSPELQFWFDQGFPVDTI